MAEEFIGAGIGFPLRSDATGGIALVSSDREIEEAIRLVLGTAHGERPMRPEFGCGIHEYVFAPADATTAGLIALRGASSRSSAGSPASRWRTCIVTDRRRATARSCASTSQYVRPRHQRPAQPRLPLLHDPRGRRPVRRDDGPARPQPRRPPLPGARRRRQAPRAAALPGVDRPQRLRPRRHAHRDVRLHDRPAAVPAQPGARPQLREVPRADRRHACSRPPRPRRRVTFWLSGPRDDSS